MSNKQNVNANAKTNPAAGEVIATSGELPISGAPIDVAILLSNFSNNDVVFGIQVSESGAQVFYFPWTLPKTSSQTVPFNTRSFIGSALKVDVLVEAAVTGKVAAAVMTVPSRG